MKNRKIIEERVHDLGLEDLNGRHSIDELIKTLENLKQVMTKRGYEDTVLLFDAGYQNISSDVYGVRPETDEEVALRQSEEEKLARATARAKAIQRAREKQAKLEKIKELEKELEKLRTSR